MPRRDRQRAVVGTVSLQLLVILVPVLFGFMGFAVDLGRLYLIRGELNQAAEAMALAAASKLIGTDASLGEATTAASLTLDAGGHGNKYNFGILTIGGATDTLTSEAPAPVLYATAAEAIGESTGAGEPATGAAAKHLRATVRADAPLLFWSFLSLGQERKVSITAAAAAGVSAPLCTACGIEPFAIAPLDPNDPTGNFGFNPEGTTTYTFGSCSSRAVIQYQIVRPNNSDSTLVEAPELSYRIGAQGLLPSPPAESCLAVGADKVTGWSYPAPSACNQNLTSPEVIRAALCGLASRLDSALASSCEAFASQAVAYSADSYIETVSEYSSGYTGDGRRIITLPVVQFLNPGGPMTVRGFRQFLLQPGINPGDPNGYFTAVYLGSVAPIRQGRFDDPTGECRATSDTGVFTGPGKVVLHR